MLLLLIGCGATWEAVDGDGDGVSVLEGDCDDADPTVALGANQLWYPDADGDGHGDPDSPVMECSPPVGYVADDGDCDDSRLDVYAGATELCDGLDNDCDGEIDDDPDDPTIFFPDADGDGYGDGDSSTASCEAPEGYITDGTDCDDTDAEVHPGSTALEVPLDGIDTDCDGNDFCTDLSCDGLPDLLLASLYDGSSWQQQVSIFRNEGGIFDSDPATLSVERVVEALVEDLNGDGYPDIVVANATNTSASKRSFVFWGSADGYSGGDAEPLPSIGASDVLAHDLNGDGLSELIFANTSLTVGGDTFYETGSLIYWASPDGFLTSPSTTLVTSGAVAVDAADLDGDGAGDVVFCSLRDDSGDPYTTSSVIYWGGDYTASTALPVDGCRGLDIADLDGDGQLDIALASYRNSASSASRSRIYWGDGARFSSMTTTDLSTVAAFSVQAADLDGDDRPELVFGSLYDDVDGMHFSETVRIYWGQEAGSYSSDAMSEVEAAGSEVPLLVDLDGDGYRELVAPGYADGSGFSPDSFIYRGSASGYSTSDRTRLSTLNAHHVTAGDLDGDGYPELIFGSYAVCVDAECSELDYHGTSRVYWGDGGEYSDDNVQPLDTVGIWAAPVIVGGP